MRYFDHLRPFVKVSFKGFKGLKWVKSDPNILKIINFNSKSEFKW